MPARLASALLPYLVAVHYPGLSSRPQLPVQRPVLNRLGNVVAGNLVGAGQVGNRAAHFQDAVVGAGAPHKTKMGPKGGLKRSYRRNIPRQTSARLKNSSTRWNKTELRASYVRNHCMEGIENELRLKK